MEYRNLGSSGLVVSTLGLGCNNIGSVLDAAGTREVVSSALDAGITFFDTADVYNEGRSEEFLGAALQGHRDRVVLSTKCGGERDLGYGAAAGSRGSRKYLRLAVERSLKRLNTDWIDLLQFHRPDPTTPIAETLTALNEMIREGKIRYISCCGFPAWQLVASIHVAHELHLDSFIAVQHQWSLLNRAVEREIVPAARHYGLATIPSFPLASGLLTGKVAPSQPAPGNSRLAGWASHFITPANTAKIETLRQWATAHERTMLEVAIGWLLAQPTISCVATGATSAQQILANVAAASWKPTPAEVAALATSLGPP